MSQSGRLIGNEPVPGAGIQTITGNAGGAVTGDGVANINIVGAGDIDVTGNVATNTLTISSSGTASEYVTDDGNFATPALGILNILGTATQIQTSSAGNTVTLEFESDVTIPNNLTVTNNLEVFNDLTVGNNLTVTVGDIDVSAGNISVAGSVTGDQLVAQNGLQVNAGGINSTGQVFLNGTGFAATGVLIRDLVGAITSSNGANGQVLIGGGLVPAWSSIVAGSGIVITPGVNTLTIASQNSVAQSFHEDVGIAVPALGVLNIVGSANINTSGAANTATINLNNDIVLNSVTADTFVANTSITSPIATITNNLTVTNTITATTITAAGTIQGSTLHSTQDITAARDIIATRDVQALGDVTATHDVLVGNDLAVANDVRFATATSGVIQTDAVGYISATNGNPTGTNGQLLISGPASPSWNALESADGSVAITYPGNSRINLSAPASAGFAATSFKMALPTNFAYPYNVTKRYLGADRALSVTAASGGYDGSGGANIYLGDGAGAPATYTAPSTGLYTIVFNMVEVASIPITKFTAELIIYIETTGLYNQTFESHERLGPNYGSGFYGNMSQNIRLTAGDIVRCSFIIAYYRGSLTAINTVIAGSYFSGIRIA